MGRKKEYIRWAIAGEVGLYTGQHLRRIDAIAEHVSMLNKDVSRWAGNRLDTAQLDAWHRCQKKGDRAVKVLIRLVGGAR